MSDMLLFLDVNVPMYAAGKAHAHKEACTWILTEIAHNRLSAAIDTEIIQEVLYRYGALQEWELAVEMATGLLDLVPVVIPVTADVVQTAVQLFGQYAPEGVKARDVIHAAVMRHHGLTKIISADQYFDRIDGITRLSPEEMFTSGNRSR